MSPAPSTKPYLASTVLLVRDGNDGLEVFLEKRHIKSDFVGGAYVFPGGRVDPEDTFPGHLLRGLEAGVVDRALELESGGIAHWVAAIRECFEEAGVLLAYRRQALEAVTGTRRAQLIDFADAAVEDHFRALRDQLNAGELTWQQMIEQEDLVLATDQMAYWAHWITPEGMPRIYDTRFFIAHAPEDQTATHDDWELTSSAWVRPGEAIERAMRREWMIIYPTLVNLKQLGEHATADDAVRAAAAQPTPLPANQPRIYDNRVVLPGDEGYDEAERDATKFDPHIFEKSFRP